MASISRDPSGTYRIQFKGLDGKRKTIRLSGATLDDARQWKAKIETIVSDRIIGKALDSETSRWVRKLSDPLAEKLAAHGLIESRGTDKPDALAGFIDTYIKGRAIKKPNTLRNYNATRRLLVEYFGEKKLLRDITPGDADMYKQHLIGKDMATATVSREVKRARQYFRAALRQKLIEENPFADVKGGPQDNPDRLYFVTREEIGKVLEACPDAQWRLIVSLARYGGLRCPSEVLALTWRDVDWERKRIRVPSPKTEHNPGGKSRIIPLFPELVEPLDTVYHEAKPNTKYVITKYRDQSVNLRSRLLDIIWSAGLREWPKPFQNMRSTRETELAEEHPMHVICAWIGNSEPVARKHYLQITDAHFAKAAESKGGGKLDPGPRNPTHNPTQYTRATPRTGPSKKSKSPAFAEKREGLLSCTDVHVPPRGVEPLSSD